MEQENKNLIKWRWSHDKDGRHAHIMSKNPSKDPLKNRKADDLEAWYVAAGTPALLSSQMITLDWPWYILWQGQILLLKLLYGKSNGFYH